MPLISQIYFWNKTTCFRQFLCPSSGVFHCTYSNGICHTGLLTACELDRDVSSRSSSQALELYMFQTIPVSIIRSFSLCIQQWYMSYRFADSLRAGLVCSVPIQLAGCRQTCMTNTIAVCTVKNS